MSSEVEVALKVNTTEAEAAINQLQNMVALSALDDIMTVLEWLGATKTPTKVAEAALVRLRARAKSKVPLDVKIITPE